MTGYAEHKYVLVMEDEYLTRLQEYTKDVLSGRRDLSEDTKKLAVHAAQVVEDIQNNEYTGAAFEEAILHVYTAMTTLRTRASYRSLQFCKTSF